MELYCSGELDCSPRRTVEGVTETYILAMDVMAAVQMRLRFVLENFRQLLLSTAFGCNTSQFTNQPTRGFINCTSTSLPRCKNSAFLCGTLTRDHGQKTVQDSVRQLIGSWAGCKDRMKWMTRQSLSSRLTHGQTTSTVEEDGRIGGSAMTGNIGTMDRTLCSLEFHRRDRCRKHDAVVERLSKIVFNSCSTDEEGARIVDGGVTRISLFQRYNHGLNWMQRFQEIGSLEDGCQED